MATFEAYLDESGTDDGSPAVAVGGYFMRTEEAARMDRAWRAVLAQYRLPFFHMVDCAHGNKPFEKMSVGARIAVEKKTHLAN